MWVVSSIIVDGKEAHSIYTVDFMKEHPEFSPGGMRGVFPHQLKITTMNIDTGETETAHGCFGSDFADLIKKYKPYGFAKEFVYPYLSYNKKAKTGAFVVTTKVDVQFLEIVKSVRRVPLFVGMQANEISTLGHKLYRYEHCWFDSINKEKTLFVGEPAKGGVKVVCSLFEAICYQSDGWFGDTFYLAAPLWSKLELPFAYKVRFKDVQKARRMISKAAMMNNNAFARSAEIYKYEIPLVIV